MIFIKKVFLVVLCIAVACCFIFFVAPKNSNNYFTMFQAISSTGETFRNSFYTSMTNYIQLLNKFSQIDISISADNMIHLDFAKDFSVLGILKYIATLLLSPLYFIGAIINFYVSLFKTGAIIISTIFNGFIGIDELEVMKGMFTIL